MSTTIDEARPRAARTYHSAAAVYDDPATTFWEQFDRRTIERLQLGRGAVVLDVCCGNATAPIA